ncbi:protein-tyrosine sulfotransferase 1-like isoform X3 [Panulirus ornatus]|uniref:protein-tyrosine sulfotransferase 1-like isoform X3 n=1 Tax=Panulirus ornatus TaxID=150431 RepID=UPI003A83EF1F
MRARTSSSESPCLASDPTSFAASSDDRWWWLATPSARRWSLVTRLTSWSSSTTPQLARYVATGKSYVVMWRMVRRYLPHALVGAVILVLIYRTQRPCQDTLQRPHRQHVTSDSSGALHNYDRNEPMIFIGGMPRSGTTLARAMLDAHPEIRCGEETRVVPRILQMRQQWKRSAKESVRLQEAGVTDEVLDEAISSFILDIVVNHGQPASRLCNKDPFTLKSATYLSKLFPHAKFLFMVRDGRATVHSIISRKVTITGFDLSSYKQCLQRWNSAVQTMNTQCEELGSSKCLPVYYEQLVLHPQEWMRKILDFLDVPWDEAVLHHEEHINKPGGVSLSKVERSSDQVIKPINLDALTKWVGQIPKEVVEDMANIAPMLANLGYDPYGNPPNYGQADALVANNTKRIQKELGGGRGRGEAFTQ